MFMVSILFLPLIFFANIIRLFVAAKSFNEKLSDKTVVHRLPCRGGSCKAFLSFQIPENLNLKQYLNLYALAFRIFFTKYLAVTNIRFYFANNNIYVGELTFFPNAGFCKIEPKELEHTLGDWIKLPIE